MQSHGSRSKYLIEESECETNPLTSCPVHLATAASDQPEGAAPAQVKFKFDWMFGKPVNPFTPGDLAMIQKLTDLGTRLSERDLGQGMDDDQEQSGIPAGYTYLGQFIAHEITFHDTQELPPAEPMPENSRSPAIDLDSLYGAGPAKRPELYEEDHARLKVGETAGTDDFRKTFPNDLPRDKNAKKKNTAFVVDPRNDENLAVAQTHLAFIKFHNRVVDILEADGCPPESVFECARAQVVRHFQWLILKDYLPRVLDEGVLASVLKNGPSWINEGDKMFMPLEFSVAAFRFGHSMVRQSYEWNSIHSSGTFTAGSAKLAQLFGFTSFSGNLGGAANLKSDWIIDWRRFYDFSVLEHDTPVTTRNNARRIDTRFDLHIDKISGFPHHDMPKSVIIRNLLRGLSLGLPTGEEVAQRIGETELTHDELTGKENLLSDPVFDGRTPLWYYILKEAEVQKQGRRLGRVGSRIVAETFVGLIKYSPHSVIKTPGEPRFGVFRPASGEPRFTMATLLDFAKTINPIGEPLKGSG